MPREAFAVQLAGLGKFLPERVVTNGELEQALGLRPGWVERATGVRERRRAESGASSAAMAVAAARQALERAGRSVEELDVIVGASSGPQQLIPCTAALVQRELGAPEGKSACFDISATCLSFPVALQLLAPLVAAGTYKAALVFSSELTEHSLNPSEPESATLLGDAAAAAVLVPTPVGAASALHHSAFETHAASGAHLTQFLGGGSHHHPNDPATTREMNLFTMHGPQVFRLAAQHMPPFLARFFREAEVSPESIERIVPHQASGRGISVVASRCGLPAEKLYTNLPVRGNCIAASIPLALCEAWESGALVRGERVLLVGTGAGLTLGAALLTF